MFKKVLITVLVVWGFSLSGGFCQENEIIFLTGDGKIKYLLFDYSQDYGSGEDSLAVFEGGQDGSPEEWYEKEYIKKILDRERDSSGCQDEGKTQKEPDDVYGILEVYEDKDEKDSWVIRNIYRDREANIIVIEKDTK